MTAPRRRTPEPGASLAPKPTAAQRKRYETRMKELETSRRARAAGWSRYWDVVAEVLSEGLYRAAGTSTAQAWLATHVAEPYRTALRSVRVAQHAAPIHEARWGVDKLDAAIAYVESELGPPVKGKLPVGFEELRIPVARRGKPRLLGLDEVAPDEIESAIGAVHAGNGGRKRAPADDGETTTALRAVRALRGVRLRPVDGHVSFGHIPLAHLEVALRALAKVDWRTLADGTPAPPAGLPNPVARAVVAREKVRPRGRSQRTA